MLLQEYDQWFLLNFWSAEGYYSLTQDDESAAADGK